MRLLVLVIFVFFAVTDVGAKKIVLTSLDFPQGKSMRQEEVKQPDFEFDHHTYDFGKFSKKKNQHRKCSSRHPSYRHRMRMHHHFLHQGTDTAWQERGDKGAV